MRVHRMGLGVSLAGLTLLTSSAAFALAISVTPLTDHPGAKDVKVNGSGFGANAAVDIYFDTTDELLVATSSTGAFAKHSLPVSAFALPGEHWVTAVERDNGAAVQKLFTVSTPWVEHGFNAKGKRSNPYENVLNTSNVANLDLFWTVNTGTISSSSPAVANGILYIGTDDGFGDGEFWAVDTATGLVPWLRGLGPFFTSPAVVKGIVYAGSGDHNVYAFDAATGATLWTAATGGYVASSPAVANGVVYAGSGDGKLYALDASSGSQVWASAATSGAIISSPAVVNGSIYVGSNNILYSFDAFFGSPIWTLATGAQIESSAAVTNGVVYIGSDDKKLYAVDASSGTILWSALTGDVVTSSPAVANGIVYVGSADSKLYAFTAETGTLRWSQTVGGPIRSSPAVANGIVYVGSEDTKLYAFNAISGAKLWFTKTGGGIDSSPTISDGVVFVGSNDHNIYAYALNGGNNAAYRNRQTTPPSFASLHPDFRLNLSR